MVSAYEGNKKHDASKNIDESKKTENKEKAANPDNKIGKIVEKLFRYISYNEFELCICFDGSFKYKGQLIEAFSVLEEFNVRLAVMTWSSRTDVKYFEFKTVKNKFKYSENLLDCTAKPIDDVRKCILNLNWSKHNNLKAILYIFSAYDRFPYNVYNYRNDAIDQQIYSRGINKIQICMENINEKSKNVEFFKNLIKKQVKQLEHEDDSIRLHLINLKRCIVFDEVTLNKFTNNYIQKTTNQECNIDTKYIKLEFSKNDWREERLTPLSPSEQVHLHEITNKNIRNASDFSCNFIAYTYYNFSNLSYSKIKHRIENIFLDENVNNVQINDPYFKLINIHLTTNLLANKFNEKSSYKIMLPAAYLFKSLKDDNYKFVREYPYFSNNYFSNVLKEDERAIFAAFSHFTYKYTNKKLMVVGLKGQYLYYYRTLELDESVIFSSGQTQKYGASDLGDFGIKRFLDNHVCSKICNEILMKI